MSEIVLMSDHRVAAVAVADCGEPLVNVRRTGALLVDARKQDPADAFAHLREGVLERLLAAYGGWPGELPDGMVALVLRRPLLGAADRSGGGLLRRSSVDVYVVIDQP
jgi:hypothetical protein